MVSAYYNVRDSKYRNTGSPEGFETILILNLEFSDTSRLIFMYDEKKNKICSVIVFDASEIKRAFNRITYYESTEELRNKLVSINGNFNGSETFDQKDAMDRFSKYTQKAEAWNKANENGVDADLMSSLMDY